MSSNTVGTLKKAAFDGESYDVAADSKVDLAASAFETEGQATTGPTLFKMVKRVESGEGIEIIGAPPALERLRAKANSLSDITMALTFIDGSVYRATGRIHADKWDSSTGKVSVNLIPSGSWTPFLA